LPIKHKLYVTVSATHHGHETLGFELSYVIALYLFSL